VIFIEAFSYPVVRCDLRVYSPVVESCLFSQKVKLPVKFHFFFCASLIMVMTGAISPALAQKQPDASPDEYRVYEVVFNLIDHIPKKDPHVSIFNVTLNSKCGEDAYPAPLANDCTFLWIKPDTADSVKRRLHEEWAGMENSTWSDFEGKNATSINLHEPISTPWKHKLIGPDYEPSKDWGSPDLAIFLSRVGFNQKRTEAIVYVLMFSYMDQVATTGDYFLFRLDKTGHWETSGRVTYFQQG
jgi:hypothetical protein